MIRKIRLTRNLIFPQLTSLPIPVDSILIPVDFLMLSLLATENKEISNIDKETVCESILANKWQYEGTLHLLILRATSVAFRFRPGWIKNVTLRPSKLKQCKASNLFRKLTHIPRCSKCVISGLNTSHYFLYKLKLRFKDAWIPLVSKKFWSKSRGLLSMKNMLNPLKVHVFFTPFHI